MRVWSWSIIVAAVALSACQQQAPAPSPGETTAASASAVEVAGPELRLLAFGDSLFSGYGLTDPAEQSYPAQLEQALRQAGRQRLAFTLDNQPVKPDLVLLELGGNDLLRGLPPSETRANLDAMLSELAKRDISVVLMGLQAPPNAGAQFQGQFDRIYGDLAKQHGATLVPFVTAKAFADPKLIQADHVHPTAQGVAMLVGATEDAIAKALPPSPAAGG